MRIAAAGLLLAAWWASPAHAQTTKPAPATTADTRTPDAKGSAANASAANALDTHRRDDVVRHRAIAAAHDAAARCLETGQKETVCQDALRKACEGIAVGRYCGMKHSH